MHASDNSHDRPPEVMNGCLVDAVREGFWLFVWQLRSDPTDSYGSVPAIDYPDCAALYRS